MATVYRVDTSIKLMPGPYGDRNNDPQDARTEDGRLRNTAHWPSKRDSKSPSATPVVAKIEPIQRLLNQDGSVDTAASDKTQSRDDRIEELLSDPSYINYKESHGIKKHKHAIIDGVDQNDDCDDENAMHTSYFECMSPPSVDLEAETMSEIGTGQSSPGSICSADSGIGSTQSITDLCSQETTTDMAPHSTSTSTNTRSMNLYPSEERQRVDDDDAHRQSTGTLLKRFIKRNLRLSNLNSSYGENTTEQYALEASNRQKINGTPEPQPFYKVDVTANDRIWQKDPQPTDRFARQFNSLEISDYHSLSNLPDGELPSDTESESSQDTIILMTSQEYAENKERIARSAQLYDEMNLVKNDSGPRDTHIRIGVNDGNLIEVDAMADENASSQSYRLSDRNAFINAHGNKLRFDTVVANEENGTQQQHDIRNTELPHSSASMEEQNFSRKTYYGYLTRNRIPSFRKMNQGFRKPALKRTKKKKVPTATLC